MRQPTTVCRPGSSALRCLPVAVTLFGVAPALALAQTPPAETTEESKKAGPAAEPRSSTESRAGSTSSPVKTAVEPANSAGKPASPEKVAPEAAKTSDMPAFVDRDGDGIQDGQEHRFRHRKNAGKHRSGSCGAASGGVRARERNGQEDSQKQHQGSR